MNKISNTLKTAVLSALHPRGGLYFPTFLGESLMWIEDDISDF